MGGVAGSEDGHGESLEALVIRLEKPEDGGTPTTVRVEPDMKNALKQVKDAVGASSLSHVSRAAFLKGLQVVEQSSDEFTHDGYSSGEALDGLAPLYSGLLDLVGRRDTSELSYGGFERAFNESAISINSRTEPRVDFSASIYMRLDESDWGWASNEWKRFVGDDDSELIRTITWVGLRSSVSISDGRMISADKVASNFVEAVVESRKHFEKFAVSLIDDSIHIWREGDVDRGVFVLACGLLDLVSLGDYWSVGGVGRTEGRLRDVVEDEGYEWSELVGEFWEEYDDGGE